MSGSATDARSAAGAAVLACLVACTPTPPRPLELRGAVAEYLFALQKKTCKGDITLDRIDVRRVGEYRPQYGGGFAVYADFAVSCREPRRLSTFSASDGATTQTALCFARRKGDGWECIVPAEAAASASASAGG